MSDPRPPDTETTTFYWSDELGEWVERAWTSDELAQRSAQPVPPPRPPDTATSTWESHVEWVGDVPTYTWIERLWTAQEREARALEDARLAARATVRQILADLQAERARLQAVLDATNSTINASPAQYVKDTARASLRIASAALDLARYVG